MADTLNPDKTATTSNDGGDGQSGLKFSEEQQKLLNEIIEKRLARANKEVRAELDTLKSEKAQLLQQLEEAKNTLANSAKGSSQAQSAADDIDSIKNQLEELQKANKQLLSEKDELRKAEAKAKTDTEGVKQQMLEYKKRTEMQFAAQKQPFIDLEAVIVLTERFVKYDPATNNFVVINEKGGERYSTTNVGDPMTLEEFYAEYAQQKKHLVRGDAVIGTGSTENSGINRGVLGYKVEDIFGPTSSSIKAAELAKVNKTRYNELKQEAIKRGLLGRLSA